MSEKKIPRFLIAAPASGSGKTMITCGILQLLVNRGLKVSSYKSGPDYIDPMFHSTVIGTKSRNLDPFFANREILRGILTKNSAGADISVIEGVMGYYDGLAGISSMASAWDVADKTDTPTVFLLNCKGLSVSAVPFVKGFLEYKEKSHIKGVILNQLSPMMFPRMKELLEKELSVQVLGYVPVMKDIHLESRHLGLVMPDEITDLRIQLNQLADVLEKSIDVDALLAIAGEAPPVAEVLPMPERQYEGIRIGLAKDEAFCFFYEDNLEYLRQMGAELVLFSPIHDQKLPDRMDGILLHGGYPELYAKRLGENKTMKQSIRKAVKEGMPCMAECGGFMYLHEAMQGDDGSYHEMLGIIPGTVHKTDRLRRFGYITLSEGTAFGEDIGSIPAHEFHYYDSENCGEAFLASKPLSNRTWRCIHSDEHLFAGYPHVYYYGNQKLPHAFLRKCKERKLRK